MEYTIDTKKFCLYRLHDKDSRYVAIPLAYQTVIDRELSQYGTYENVPVDKTVRGIFLDQKKGEWSLNENAPQNDITICSLIPL